MLLPVRAGEHQWTCRRSAPRWRRGLRGPARSPRAPATGADRAVEQLERASVSAARARRRPGRRGGRQIRAAPMPNVKRRLAAVLATAVSVSATALAAASRAGRPARRTAARRRGRRDPIRKRHTRSATGVPPRAGRRARCEDVHARVRVVDPVDRDLVDAHAAALGDDQQLGVEEPAVVADGIEQLWQHVGAHGLEAALGVAELARSASAQQAVVGARDELALRSPRHPRAGRQPRADRHLAVSGEQR